MLVEGDRCSPYYDTCYGTLQCLENYNDYYTCGGVIPWDGSAPYVKQGFVQASSFSINLPFLISGIIVLVLYALFLVYELFIVDDGIYENNKSSRRTQHDGEWSFGKLFRSLRGE